MSVRDRNDIFSMPEWKSRGARVTQRPWKARVISSRNRAGRKKIGAFPNFGDDMCPRYGCDKTQYCAFPACRVITLENRHAICRLELVVCNPGRLLCGYRKSDYYRGSQSSHWPGKLNQRTNWTNWEDECDYRADSHSHRRFFERNANRKTTYQYQVKLFPESSVKVKISW